MNVHLVSVSNYPHAFCEMDKLKYWLESFAYINKHTEAFIERLGGGLLFDSGAFTFMMGGGKRTDFDAYLDKYIKFVRKYNIQRFFELDIDVVVGLKKVEDMRKRLEDGVGRASIPVWHIGRGLDYYLKMCEDYDYVSIGGVANGELSKGQYKFFPWFIDEAHKRGTKVHCLWLTSMPLLQKYHFDSVDSTTWVGGRRFGLFYHFNGRRIVTHRNPGVRIADSYEADRLNIREWIKFQLYAEDNL